MNESRILTGGILLSAVIFLLLLPGRLAIDPAVTFQDDAADYHTGAINIARSGFYSLDGSEPAMGREPGYSLFLGSLYLLFGEGNRAAIFTAQWLLHLLSVLLFLREFRRVSSGRATILCGLFLLLLPPIFHLVFTVYRESLALSLSLLLAALILKLVRESSPFYHDQSHCSTNLHEASHRQKGLGAALAAGACLSAVVLTYFPFLFLPFFLAGLLWFWRVKRRLILTMLVVSLLFVSAWPARNAFYGQPKLLEPHRTASVWSLRAQQAEELKGMDPLRCLFSEYITRRWPERLSGRCRPEGFRHAPWMRAFAGTEEGQRALTREAHRRIAQNLPMYLWGSLIWAAEYHLPLVNGWGFWYNVLAAAGEAIVVFGLLLYLRHIRTHFRPELLLFLVIPLYATSVFSLTVALPRYRAPVLFCYYALAAIGYASTLKRRFFRGSRSESGA